VRERGGDKERGGDGEMGRREQDAPTTNYNSQFKTDNCSLLTVN